MPDPEKYANGGIIHGRDPDDDTVPVWFDFGCAYSIPRAADPKGHFRLIEAIQSRLDEESAPDDRT